MPLRVRPCAAAGHALGSRRHPRPAARVPPRCTAARSTAPWPAGPSTRNRPPSGKTWPAGATAAAFWSGFLERRPSQGYQNDETGHLLTQRNQFVGQVKAVRDGRAEVEPMNRLAVGDWARAPPPQRQPHCAPGPHQERQRRSDRRGPPAAGARADPLDGSADHARPPGCARRGPKRRPKQRAPAPTTPICKKSRSSLTTTSASSFLFDSIAQVTARPWRKHTGRRARPLIAVRRSTAQIPAASTSPRRNARRTRL